MSCDRILTSFIILGLIFACTCEITKWSGDLDLEISPPANPYILRRAADVLNLTCHVNNHGNNILRGTAYNLTWRLPLNSINSKHRIVSYSGPEGLTGLMFHSLQESDSGDYVCHSSELGLTKSAKLTVKPIKKPYCGDKMFVCTNGNCIIEHYVCDGRPDCKSGDDEDVTQCGTNPCQGKLKCEDGRCIPIEWCCDQYHDPNCTVRVKPGCCAQLSIPYQEHDTNYLSEDEKHISDMGFLQTTIYTIIACSLAFMIIVLLLVSAICKVHIRRTNHCRNHIHSALSTHPLARHTIPLSRSCTSARGRRNFYLPGNIFAANRPRNECSCNCTTNLSFNHFMNRYDQVPSYDTEYCNNENCINFNDMVELRNLGSVETSFELSPDVCDNNRLNINENNNILNRILIRLRGLNLIHRNGSSQNTRNLSMSNRFLTPILQRMNANAPAAIASEPSSPGNCLTVNYNINSGIQILGESLGTESQFECTRNIGINSNCSIHGEPGRNFGANSQCSLHQFVGRPVAPPPYSEIVQMPPKIGPPPPYVSCENIQVVSTPVPASEAMSSDDTVPNSPTAVGNSNESSNNNMDNSDIGIDVQNTNVNNQCDNLAIVERESIQNSNRNKLTDNKNECEIVLKVTVSISDVKDISLPSTSGLKNTHQKLNSGLDEISYIDSDSDLSDAGSKSLMITDNDNKNNASNETLPGLVKTDQNVGSLTTLDRFFPDDHAIKHRNKKAQLKLLNLKSNNLDRTALRNDVRNKPSITDGQKHPELTIRHSLGDLSPMGSENRTLFDHDLSNVSNNLRMSDRFLTLPLRESFIGLRNDT